MNRLPALLGSLLAVAACSNDVHVGNSSTTGQGSAGSPAGGGAGGAGGFAAGGAGGSAAGGTGGSTAGDAGGSTAGGTGGTGGAGLPPCDEPGMMPWQPPNGWVPFACDLPKPCPHLIFNSWSEPGWPGTPTFQDPEAASCILAKLRDREVSALSWSNNKSGMWQYNETEDVFIVDGEHAVSNWSLTKDLDKSTGTRHRQLLEDPAYFEGCLQLTDPTEIYACLVGWSAGCDDTEVGCPVP